MEWFKFNEYDSTDKLIIKEMPPVQAAKRMIDSIEVNGRNGKLHIDNGTYESLSKSIICVLTDFSNLDELKAKIQGIGTLELSTEPNRVFKAMVKNQIDFSKYFGVLKEFPIQFEVDPISYSKTETTLTKTANGTFEALGNVEVSPILEIKGTGDGSITLNNVTINLTDMSTTPIIIDCSLMEAVQGLNNANSKINCDEFPVIKNDNVLSMINVTEIVIKYKEGWL